MGSSSSSVDEVITFLSIRLEREKYLTDDDVEKILSYAYAPESKVSLSGFQEFVRDKGSSGNTACCYATRSLGNTPTQLERYLESQGVDLENLTKCVRKTAEAKNQKHDSVVDIIELYNVTFTEDARAGKFTLHNFIDLISDDEKDTSMFVKGLFQHCPGIIDRHNDDTTPITVSREELTSYLVTINPVKVREFNITAKRKSPMIMSGVLGGLKGTTIAESRTSLFVTSKRDGMTIRK
mmetsp:Transcript_1494/g.2144  ORF Transcript_1494/g.2144 Transcript_1494/m.2144 type:complete len:238 (+) Transcript_1494:71-784(+)